MRPSLLRRVAAEFFGSLFLLAAVVGSGIMGERLAGGNVAITLLANSMATGTALIAILLAFGPISGAHLNPAVTLADAWGGGVAWRDTPSQSQLIHETEADRFSASSSPHSACWR
jgi:glycerol uptake facilitator-like aquaporin